MSDRYMTTYDVSLDLNIPEWYARVFMQDFATRMGRRQWVIGTTYYFRLKQLGIPQMYRGGKPVIDIKELKL